MALNPKPSFKNIFTHEPWEGQEIFCDATLKTEDGCEYRVHKIILSKKSEFFKNLFFNASEYEQINGTFIKDIDSITLESILIYVYSGYLDCNKNSIWNILNASDYFLMDDLVDKMWEMAMEEFPTETCLEALAIAGKIQKLSTTTQYNCFYRHVIMNFNENSNNIGILPLNTFKAILNENSLNVTSEEDVWKAVVNWVEVEKSVRLENVEELLKLIRLQEEVDDSLASNILSSDLVKNNPYLPYQNLTKQKNVFFPDFYNFTLGPDTLLSHPRRPNRLHFVIDDCSAFLDHSTGKVEHSLYLTYDDEFDFVRNICSLQANKILMVGHHLYLFHTSYGRGEGFSYNILNESLSPLQLPTPREKCSVVAIGDSVYVIGGDGVFSSTIDCYHTSLESWITVTIPRRIILQDAVSLNGSIYILGLDFTAGNGVRNICQIYKQESNSWSETSPTTLFKFGSTILAHNGKFYVFGTSRPENIEEYNPEERTWTKLPPLPLKFDYRHLKAVSFGDNIVINDFSNCTQWDINSNSWIGIKVTKTLGFMELYELCTVDDSEIIDDLTRKNRRIGIEWGWECLEIDDYE